MLFEQVARRLINIEEHQYSLVTDAEPYKAKCQSRFNNPEIIAVLGDVVRRMRLLKGTRAAVGRRGFSADLRALASASSADFMEAMHIAGPKESISSAAARPDMPAKVKSALRTLLLSTSDVPGTEGRKAQLRFNGHGNNLFFGGPSFFVTPNFADTYHPIVKLLHDGPSDSSHLCVAGAPQPGEGLSSASSSAARPVCDFLAAVEPKMPTLRRMHEIVAADSRAQAKFFLLMSELHYRFILGVERLHIGRVTLARPQHPPQDLVASSLQPSMCPGTTDVQAPLEAQGRGFTHGHGKGHSILGPTMTWLRRAIATGFEAAVRRMRSALLDTAVTVQYDAAREAGRQLGVELPPEPFSKRQQRQSRMDGGEDEDGTLREHVDLAPPLEQPHIERERCRAAAESRLALTGGAAYRGVPLTGAFQATFPAYRQRSSFGRLGDASQLTAGASDASQQAASARDLFTWDPHGQILEILTAQGAPASPEELQADAQRWAAHFALDVFHNHCSNHEHDCTDTCIKYVKKKLLAKQSLRSNKVPSCRFWYFRVKVLNGKRRRRRGKPLVAMPFIEDSDDRNQEFRCQVRREQPFRSTSNDVAQVTNRCNVDFQFLFCAPPLPVAPVESHSAAQPVVAADGAPPAKRRRLRKKTPLQHTKYMTRKARKDRPVWFPPGAQLTDNEWASVDNFSASFQKAAAMDFYITKYQGKPMESLTSLFMAMTNGIHRLEKQEQQEQEAAAAAREAAAVDQSGAAQPAQKRLRSEEELQRRARRVTIRLASMANRCFWVSAAEVVVHILTDGDCLQSHNNLRIFTRQLQWAMQQCKRILNHEAPEDDAAASRESIQAVSFQPAVETGEHKDSESESDVVLEKVEAVTASTHVSDDYAHRGPKLQSMCFYVYRMFVRRVRRPGAKESRALNIFPFEPHYVLAKSYAQEVMLHSFAIPTIDGFQCPTVHQDAEQNALLKSLLFMPFACTDPMACGSVLNFRHALSNGCPACVGEGL